VFGGPRGTLERKVAKFERGRSPRSTLFTYKTPSKWPISPISRIESSDPLPSEKGRRGERARERERERERETGDRETIGYEPSTAEVAATLSLHMNTSGPDSGPDFAMLFLFTLVSGPRRS